MSDLGKFARRRGEMPFLDHLEELRWRILWSMMALVVGSVISFALVYYLQVLELLVQPIRDAYNDQTLQLIFLSPADPFFVTLRLAIYGGIILSFPILVYQIWSFLAPALEKEERRAIVPALYLGLVLFVGGVAQHQHDLVGYIEVRVRIVSLTFITWQVQAIPGEDDGTLDISIRRERERAKIFL